MRFEDLKDASWGWDAEKHGGQWNHIPLGARIYMPFDGYANPFVNMALRIPEIRILSRDRSIQIQLLGYFEIRDLIRTPGTLVRKGTWIAEFRKNPPKDNMFKQDQPFLIVYVYRDGHVDPDRLWELFPHIR